MKTYPDVTDLHHAVVHAFCELVEQTLAQQDVFRVSLSGGSTPKRIYELLTERDLPWSKIHFYWGDERNVAHDHDESNAKMVATAMLDHVAIPSGNIHRVPVCVDDPAAASLAYESTLREHFAGQAYPAWDLALLGMGDDAHTASLFPETKAIDEQSRWFVENWVEKFDTFRYTLTAPAINSARECWFMVAGSGKREALASVFASEKQPARFPSQLIDPTRWFVTEDALE